MPGISSSKSTGKSRHQLARLLEVFQLEERDLPAVLTVAPSGIDQPGRGAPDAPFQTLQFAVNQAFTGDTILLASGTYRYNAAASAPYANEPEFKQVVTILNKQLAIYGGYSTADNFATANPQANPTYIDGEGQYRGIYVIGRNAPTSLDLQGVTIRNGLAGPRSQSPSVFANVAFGGGVYIDMGNTDASKASTLPFTIKNVTFENNQAIGGGPTNIPEASTGGAGSGGAIFAIYANDLRLDNIIFRNNVAIGGDGAGTARGGPALGGAIHTNYTRINANNIVFEGNKAQGGPNNGSQAGAPFFADATGGAVALQLSSNGTFTNVLATNNQAIGGDDANTTSGHGGGAYGGVFFAEVDTQLTIRDAVLNDNLVQGGRGFKGGIAGGGAVETDNADLTLERVKMLRNRAIGGSRTSPNGEFGAVSGGAVYSFRVGQNGGAIPRGVVNMSNVLIADNRAELAADIPAGFIGAGSAAGVRLTGVDANLSHMTFANNILGPGLVFGAALILQSDGSPAPTNVTLAHSIIANHGVRGSSPITVFNASTLTLEQTLFYNNTNLLNNETVSTEIIGIGGGPNNNPGVINGIGTNLEGNPGFIAPGAPLYDYGISATGRAANVASSSQASVDLGNQTRVGVPDLGAFEAGTSGALPVGSTASGGASTTGTGGYDSFPTSPPPPTIGGPLLVGYPQFAVGPGLGGGPSVDFYQPNGALLNGGPAFTNSAFTGGVRTASGDFNGDGIADIVVGTGPGIATQVRVINPVNRAVLAEFAPFEPAFTGGIFVAVGDINGDGVPELIVTPDEGGGPRVQVYNGRGFVPIANFFGIDDPNFRGGARAAVGDINGDGYGDIVVAAGFQGGPRVAGFDGKTLGTGTRIFADFFAFEQNLRNGIFLAVGDTNGDGYADLIAGGGPGGGPRVTVFSGKALMTNQYEILANFFGGDPSNRGGVRLAVKNLDGDTRADLLVGGGTGTAGRVTAYAGNSISTTGAPSVLFELNPFPGAFLGGVFIG